METLILLFLIIIIALYIFQNLLVRDNSGISEKCMEANNNSEYNEYNEYLPTIVILKKYDL